MRRRDDPPLGERRGSGRSERPGVSEEELTGDLRKAAPQPQRARTPKTPSPARGVQRERGAGSRPEGGNVLLS